MTSWDVAIAAAEELAEVLHEAGYRAAEMTCLAYDDTEDMHVAAAVQDRQLVYLGISDGLIRTDIGQLQDSINGMIGLVFSMEKLKHIEGRPDFSE